MHDVLAVDDRSHEACAVTVQIGPQLAGQGEELFPAIPIQQGRPVLKPLLPRAL
jgi:hypothetical protein